MKKLLVILILLVPMMLSASIIDENSPLGICVWKYVPQEKTIDEVMDSVVSLGCSWIRLSGFGGLRVSETDIDYSAYDPDVDWPIIFSKVSPWVKSAKEHNLNVILATWPQYQTKDMESNHKADCEEDWQDFWNCP